MGKRLRRVGRIISIVLVGLLLLVVGTVLYLDYSLERVPVFTDYDGRVTESAGTNWLLIGSDSREDLSQGQKNDLVTGDESGSRTDTIMLLHIPAGSERPTLISLPRDTLVTINDQGPNKLNAAYTFGGPTLLARTVEEATGLRINHYVEVGLGGFDAVVDAVGGVAMCVDAPIHDPKINLDLSAGCQNLTGAQALGYVRTRAFAGADFERVQHQREFFSTLASKATSGDVLANPLRSLPLVQRSTGALTVADGDHLYHLVSLALAVRGAGTGGLLTTTVPVGGATPVPGVGDAVQWDKEKSSKLFAALKQDKPVPRDAIVPSG